MVSDYSMPPNQWKKPTAPLPYNFSVFATDTLPWLISVSLGLDMETLRSYNNVGEAGFAQSLLEASGIPASLEHEAATSLSPAGVSEWGMGSVLTFDTKIHTAGNTRPVTSPKPTR